MPAYANVSLVTAVFHPSDIAFVRGWSAAAPGYGGWGVQLDRDEATEQVSVVPPGAEAPTFLITRHGRDVVLQQRRPDASLQELGRFENLREAVLTLCPLDETAMQEIQESLEEAYPRRDGR